MAGFADGFARGFGLMENQIARQDQREYRDKRAGLEDARYKAAETENTRRYGLEQARLKNKDKQGDDLNAARIEAANNQSTQFQMQVKAGQADMDNQAAVKVLTLGPTNGTFTPEQKKVIAKAGINLDAMRDPKFAEYNQRLEEWAKGNVRGDINSPETLEMANSLLSLQIKRGVGGASKFEDGGKIVDQQIVEMRLGDGKLYPKDSLAFQLQNTDEKGNTWLSPLTQNRSTDPNDPLKTVTIDDLFKNLIGQRKLADEPLVQKALRALGQQPAAPVGTWKDSNGTLYNDKTADTKKIEGYQQKIQTKVMDDGSGTDALWSSADGGQSWQLAKMGQADAASGQAAGNERSWEDRVKAVSEGNKVDLATAESAMLGDSRYKPFAPQQPMFGGSTSPAGPLSASDLEKKDTSKMNSDERLAYEQSLTEAKDSEKAVKRQRREQERALSKIERQLVGRVVYGGKGMVTPNRFSDQEKTAMIEQLKQMHDSTKVEAIRNRAIKAIKRLSQ